jgi:hypothetical protein
MGRGTRSRRKETLAKEEGDTALRSTLCTKTRII